MQQQKENLFLEKFCLLSSQECNEEINWSSSCSSDYEHSFGNDKSNKAVHNTRRKRKRKNKVPKNISNLSIKILDTSRERKLFCEEKSPILSDLSNRKGASVSPILQPSQRGCKFDSVSSPILSTKFAHLKSPILGPKIKSPKSVVKVRKKLFASGNINKVHINTKTEENTGPKQNLSKEEDSKDSSISCQRIKFADNNDSLNINTSTAKVELVKRVKSFFDSHFSSENTSLASQNSISEVLTPKNSTKTSDEIEIFTCKTQNTDNNSVNSIKSLKQNYSGNSSESSLYEFSKNSKKVKYRKDGHAYRLNNLLKKQNASLSLWHHEKFLAANSNFLLPKGEFTMFRILKVNFKYGCHLLETVDADDNNFLIVINSCFVSDNIKSDTVLKLYAPYKIMQYDDKSKLIINITKFECSHYKSE